MLDEVITEPTKKIEFVVPGKNAPGFARRINRVLELQELKDSGTIDKDGWKGLVEFLADYVKAPTRADAVNLVWDASEAQWDEMLDALGGASNPVPPLKSGLSENP